MADPFTSNLHLQIHRCLLVLTAMSATACSDEATLISRAPSAPDEVNGAEGGEGNVEQSPPLYLVRTTIATDDTDTGYIAAAPSLDEGNLTLDDALEYPGDVRIGG